MWFGYFIYCIPFSSYMAMVPNVSYKVKIYSETPSDRGNRTQQFPMAFSSGGCKEPISTWQETFVCQRLTNNKSIHITRCLPSATNR